ncbi:MAG: hypothetical protein C4289_04540, partial [Chloroflexota bacterium]
RGDPYATSRRQPQCGERRVNPDLDAQSAGEPPTPDPYLKPGPWQPIEQGAERVKFSSEDGPTA